VEDGVSREVVFTCTGRGTHNPATVHSWSFPDTIGSTERVRWSPVSVGETLQLTCPDCGREWWLGADKGSALIGELERRSRGLGRVVFDLSGTTL
jgi:hypothetical protein